MTTQDINTYFINNLDSVYEQLETKITSSSKLIVPDPVLERSTTNTYWKNIKKILITINRPPDHFVDYINKQLKTGEWISQSKSDGLVLIGKFSNNQITHVLHQYIIKYVICNICNSSKTILERNKDLRTFMIQCNKCNSKYTV